MRYILFVNDVAISGTIDFLDPLQFVEAAAARIFERTGRRVVGGLLGGQSWEDLCREQNAIAAVKTASAEPWFVWRKIVFVRDDRVLGAIFEAFIDEMEFYRRLTLLPNAKELLGEYAEVPYKRRKKPH